MLQVNLEAVRSLVLKGIAEMPYPDLDLPLRRAERLALPEEIKTTVEDEVQFILNDTHYKIADGHDFTKPASLPKSLSSQEVPASEVPVVDPEEEAEALKIEQKRHLYEFLFGAPFLLPIPDKIQKSIERHARHLVVREMRRLRSVNKFYELETDQERRAFYLKMVKHAALDEVRKRKWEEKFLVSIDALMEEPEEEDIPRKWIKCPQPSTRDDQDYPFLRDKFRSALLELPIHAIPLVYALDLADGNVSQLAKWLWQGQRQTARQVERIRKHFRKRGLEPKNGPRPPV